jgi:hypothetical protein
MRWFKALLGGLLVLWCPVMLLAPRWPALVVGGRWGDGLAGMAGGVLGGVGGFTGVVPTLWCTLRRYPKELQRAVIQNFNLSMLLVTMAVYLGTGMVTRGAAAVCRGGAGHAAADLAGHPALYRHQRGALSATGAGLADPVGVAMLAAAVPQLLAAS